MFSSPPVGHCFRTIIDLEVIYAKCCYGLAHVILADRDGQVADDSNTPRMYALCCDVVYRLHYIFTLREPQLSVLSYNEQARRFYFYTPRESSEGCFKVRPSIMNKNLQEIQLLRKLFVLGIVYHMRKK
jgi:hypothetical protein